MRAWWRPKWPTPITATLMGSPAIRACEPADDRDVRFVCGGEHLLAVEDQRTARIHGKDRCPGDTHRLNRGQTDDGHVEPHVLPRLGDLHDAHTRAGQMPRSRDHLVRAFHRLDGDD